MDFLDIHSKLGEIPCEEHGMGVRDQVEDGVRCGW